MLSDKFQWQSVLLALFLLRKCFLALGLVGLNGNLTRSFRSTVKMGLTGEDCQHQVVEGVSRVPKRGSFGVIRN